MTRHMTVAEWAEHIGVSRAEAYRQVAAGRITVTNVASSPKKRKLRITAEAAARYDAARAIPART